MIDTILLPIDLQETQLAEKAVAFTIEEARRHWAEVHVLTVIPGFGMPIVASYFPDATLKKAADEVARSLKAFVTDNLPDDVTVLSHVMQGNPAEKIVQQADRLSADLIVIPSHAKGLERTLLGSCASKVVDHARCSVMVIKG